MSITRRPYAVKLSFIPLRAWKLENTNLRGLFAVFISVFLAELGDKTQVATFLFATDPNLNRTGVFLASTVALALSSLIAVVIGGQVSRYVSPTMMRTVAGVGFLVIGLWFLFSARS